MPPPAPSADAAAAAPGVGTLTPFLRGSGICCEPSKEALIDFSSVRDSFVTSNN